MNRLPAYRFVVLVLLGLSNGSGQEHDECAAPLFPMDTYCENIETWDDFVLLIDESVPGDELFICPFDVDKSDMPKVNITWDISVVCVLKDETDSCTFRGSGGFVKIESDGNTLFQGFHFRDSDDYAVDVASTAANSSLITSTFCHCTFSGINRNQTTRGGAFIAQASAGVVNLLSCVFLENFSSSRGAAVYTRSSQMNIVGCQFNDNTSIDSGAAIFAARSTSLYIEQSTFIRNFGLNGYGVVVKPEDDSSVWTDGGSNLSEGGECPGFYVLADDFCQQFLESEATSTNNDSPSPTIAGTTAPSSSPTTIVDGLCFFEEGDSPCLQVDTFAEIKEAVLASRVVELCGGFEIEKPTDELMDLSGNHDIRCIETCTISGFGTHIEISGLQSQVRLSNFKFTLSDSSAVQIRTSSAGDSTTTFCNSQFFRNTGTLGGAIRIARESGQVNVVGSTFTSNEAVKGGAIYGSAQILLILESLFLNNVAVKAGSAVFTFSESASVFRSSYFAQNSVSSSNNYAVVLEAGSEGLGDPLQDSTRAMDDRGENVVVTSGSCDGFFDMASMTCIRFRGRKNESNFDFGGDVESDDLVFVTLAGNSTLLENSTVNWQNETLF